MSADTLSPVASEASFIASFVEKMDAPSTTDAPAPAPASIPSAASEPDHDADALDGAPASPPSPTPSPDATPDADDQAGTPSPADATPEKTTDDPPSDAGEGAESEDELDQDFAAAAAAAKLPLSLDDLPEAARPLAAARLKEMQAGFTRAMQDARAYRADEATFRAEERFRTEHPAMFVVELLRKYPALGEQVNALLDGLDSPTTKAAHEIVVRDTRETAAKAIAAEQTAKDSRAERGIQLDQYTRKLAKAAGVPMELGVEEGVIAHIAQHGDVTEADIDRIVKEKADKYTRHVRANRRAASQEYVKGKVETKATAGLKVKPGTGSAPAPASAPKPKSDAEFIEMMSARA